MIVYRWDVIDVGTSEDWAAKTHAWFGQIDGIVMNAGVDHAASIEGTDDAVYEALWQAEFIGPLRLMQVVMPSLRVNG